MTEPHVTNGGRGEPLVLRRGLFSGVEPACDLTIARGRVAAPGVAGALPVELAGRTVLPGLVNALDLLDLSVFPPLGTPPFASLYDWTSLAGDHPALRAALAVPLVDRLFLGGLRNLLSGVTAVVHHHPWHRSLARDDFPVRVLARYQFAHSPGLTPKLRQTYRSTDRRIPWFVRVAEGTDDRARDELGALSEVNILRQNTVILHGTALRAEDAPRIAEARAAVVWCPEADRRLYGATAPVRSLREAGVRVGLGSDSPATGSRDALSNLAAARRENVLDDAALLHLATVESALVARLPVGGTLEGSPADFVVTGALEALLEGDRRALALVVVNGCPVYGEPELMAAAGSPGRELTVDGAVRCLAEPFAVRLRTIRKAHPAVSGVPWLAGLSL